MFQNPNPLGQGPVQLRHDFSSHLRTVVLGNDHPDLNNFDYPYPEDFTHYSHEKKFRKYFGRKVTTMAYLHQTKPFDMPRHCKVLKTLAAYCSVLPKHLPRTLKSLHLSEERSFALDPNHPASKDSVVNRMTLFLNRIGYYKSLESLKLVISHSLLLKKLVTLHNLKSLTIVLSEINLLENSQVLLRLTSLQKLHLILIGSHGRGLTESQKAETQEFFRKVFASKSLSFLELALMHNIYAHDREALTNFLEMVNQSQIPSFHIYFEFARMDLTIFNQTNVVLSNIDTFTMYFGLGKKFYFSCDTQNNSNKTPISPKRILEINMQNAPFFWDEFGMGGNDDLDSFYFKPQQSEIQPETQQAFDLTESLTKIFKDCWNLPFPVEKSVDLKSLKSLSIDLRTDPGKDQIVEELTHLLKNATSLEHLGVLGLGSRHLRSNTQRSLQLFETIANLKTLKSLYLTGTIIDMKSELHMVIEKMMGSLKNVPKIDLEAQVKDSPAYFIRYLQSGSMKELSLKLPVMLGDGKKTILETILSLKDLENLTIEKGSQLLHEPKDRKKLLDAFQNMKNLKKIVMPFESFRLVEEKSQESQNLVREIQAFVEEIFCLNKSIEVVDINVDDLKEIKYTRP